MANAPFLLPTDRNGNVVSRFLDAFEAVRFDMASEPKYYGYLHHDGFYVIAKHTDAGTADEHITFYASGTGSLNTTWADRATLEYVEYDALY